MIRKIRRIGQLSDHQGMGHRLFGLALTGIGFIWLAKKAGWMSVPENAVAFFWPVAIIILGLGIALRTRRVKNGDTEKVSNKTGQTD